MGSYRRSKSGVLLFFCRKTIATDRFESSPINICSITLDIEIDSLSCDDVLKTCRYCG